MLGSLLCFKMMTQEHELEQSHNGFDLREIIHLGPIIMILVWLSLYLDKCALITGGSYNVKSFRVESKIKFMWVDSHKFQVLGLIYIYIAHQCFKRCDL